MKSIKSSVRYALQLVGKLLAKLSDANSALEVIAEAYIMELAAKKIKVKHNNLELALSGVNAINKMRAKTFSIKEPETLEWIDSFDQGSEFWDVDGIGHLILRGGSKALSSARSVLIEINDKFISQAEECRAILENAGLILDRKEHAEVFSAADSFGGGHVWNQIWVRNDS